MTAAGDAASAGDGASPTPADKGGGGSLAAPPEAAGEAAAERAGEKPHSAGGAGAGAPGLDDDEDDEDDEDGEAEPEEVPIRVEPLAQHLASAADVDAGLQLIELCRDGDLQMVMRRVKEGVPAGFLTKSGWTPVAAAASSGSNDVLLYLLDLGADAMYDKPAGAAAQAPPATARSTSSGAPTWSSPPGTERVGSNTPLHWACYKGHVDSVSLLLAAGYSAEAADSTGNRCLHLACSGGHRDVVELLLAHSAAVEPRNVYGNRALDLATDAGCRRLLARFMAQQTCEWCKESFSRLRRPSLCQHCHNVYCDTKPCSSTASASAAASSSREDEAGEPKDGSGAPDVAAALAKARSRRYCQECATDMGKAEQDLRNVLDGKLELIRRTLAGLSPGSRPATTRAPGNDSESEGVSVSVSVASAEAETGVDAQQESGDAPQAPEGVESAGEASASSEAAGSDQAADASASEGAPEGAAGSEAEAAAAAPPEGGEAGESAPRDAEGSADDSSGRRSAPGSASSSKPRSATRPALLSQDAILRALTLSQTDAEALYTALEAAQLKAADGELLRAARQTYHQLVAHVALQEEVKALLAERPVGIRALLEPLKRALRRAAAERVQPAMLALAVQVIQSAEAECTLFGCHALCAKIERGSRRHAKAIARLEASLTEAQARGATDSLLAAAGALRDRLNAEVRLEACLLPFSGPPPVELVPGAPLPPAPAPGSGLYVFADGTKVDTLLQALELRAQLVAAAVDAGTSVEGVSPALLEEGAALLKQLKKEVRDEAKLEDERRRAEEEAALKAAKKSKKKKG